MDLSEIKSLPTNDKLVWLKSPSGIAKLKKWLSKGYSLHKIAPMLDMCGSTLYSLCDRTPELTAITDRPPESTTIELQVVQPATYINYWTDSDGLARVIDSHLLLPTTRYGALNTVINVVKRKTYAYDKIVGAKLDLSGLSDGIYNIEEVASDGKPEHKSATYWRGVAIVVKGGNASLQIVEHTYGWATIKGTAVYGPYYGDTWHTTDWQL